jgi:hypothetical protein
LRISTGIASSSASGASRLGDSPGEEQRQPDARVGKQLQAGGPFEQRQMTARIFEDQRLVDHRQFEMSRRVVHWNSGIFGQ